MKQIILASMLLATPALAQPQSAPSSQKALEVMLNREMSAHQSDLAAAIELDGKVAALTKQVADLTKELADTKAATK